MRLTKLIYLALFLHMKLVFDACTGVNAKNIYDSQEEPLFRTIFKRDALVYPNHILAAMHNTPGSVTQENAAIVLNFLRHEIEKLKKASYSRHPSDWFLRQG